MITLITGSSKRRHDIKKNLNAKQKKHADTDTGEDNTYNIEGIEHETRIAVND